MLAVGGLSPAVRHSAANAASTNVLVVGFGGLLAIRLPRWWHLLQGDSGAAAAAKLLALDGLAALAGLICGLVAELFHGRTRIWLNISCLCLLAFSIVGWAIVRTAEWWRRRDENAAAR
jgi:hypothetical protein